MAIAKSTKYLGIPLFLFRLSPFLLLPFRLLPFLLLLVTFFRLSPFFLCGFISLWLATFILVYFSFLCFALASSSRCNFFMITFISRFICTPVMCGPFLFSGWSSPLFTRWWANLRSVSEAVVPHPMPPTHILISDIAEGISSISEWDYHTKTRQCIMTPKECDKLATLRRKIHTN